MTRPASFTRPLILAACGVVAACAGTIVDPDGDGAGNGTNPGGGAGGGGNGMTAEALCKDDSVPAVGPAPLRRLTRLEYDNTVRDLVGDTTGLAAAFSEDEAVGGYDANSIAAVSKLQLEDYLDAAEKIAKTAVDTKLTQVVACDITTDACAQSFVADFGRRAFRRALSSEEKTDYFDLYKSSKAQWSAKVGIELVMRAMLASPNFTYLVESTVPGSGSVARVDAYTVASRLSYFLWASMPDDDLLDAAESGALDTPTGVEAEARRLLKDPRAAATIASFHDQWLGIAHLEEAAKDTKVFPEWNDQLADSMREETRRFTTAVVLSGDAKLSTLLTSNESYIDGSLAALYGVSAPTKAWDKVTLPADERVGVLTHASMMAAHSGASETSWVHRGKVIRERFLCDPVGSPPPGVESNEAKDLARLEDPACSGCHQKMDPIGFGFDAYSPTGSYRLVDEHGKAVTTAGNVADTEAGSDIAGQFDGAVELAHKLAASEDVGRCVAVQWFRYATRRVESDQDACSVAALQKKFAESNYDVRELLVAIATTDSFRYRAVEK